MKLEGSCHCRSVKFSLQSQYPYPFNICYCSICRKTAGSGGYAINLSGDAATLEVQGRENLSVYQATRTDTKTGIEASSTLERNFCRVCGSHLWCWDARWPDFIHPHAGAIDTALPEPPEHTHLMVGSRAPWVPVTLSEKDQQFEEYPTESIADWHARLNLTR